MIWLIAFATLALALIIGNLMILRRSAKGWRGKLPPAKPYSDDDDR